MLDNGEVFPRPNSTDGNFLNLQKKNAGSYQLPWLCKLIFLSLCFQEG